MSHTIELSSPVGIEKNIPVPTHRLRRVWPLADMEVGDSFQVDPLKVNGLRSSVHHEQRRSGKRFTIRQTPEGIRCWRIA